MAINPYFLLRIKSHFFSLSLALSLFTVVSAYQWNHSDFGKVMEPPEAEKEFLKMAGIHVTLHSITDHPESRNQIPHYQWKDHSRSLLSLIKKNAPDVLALSETPSAQIGDLENSLSNYFHEGCFSISHHSYPTYSHSDLVAKLMRVLFNSSPIRLQNLPFDELGARKKSNHILVPSHVTDIFTNRSFAVVASHFDSSSLEARIHAGKVELQLIQKLESLPIPWLSSAQGQECAEEYIYDRYIRDSRDETKEGDFASLRIFPGHLELPECFAPLLQTVDSGLQKMNAATLDVAFRSKNLRAAIHDDSSFSEFDPSSLKLYPNNLQDFLEKTFIFKSLLHWWNI